jgi:hypothetical protein
MSSSSTTSTSVQNTLGLNLSILELLINSSGKMPQLVLLPFGHSGGATAAVGGDLAALASSDHHRAPGLINNNQLPHGTTPTHKRAKRTTGRVCGQCGTSSTVQWRKGPDGSTSYVVTTIKMKKILISFFL